MDTQNSWLLNELHKDAKKFNEVLTAEARKLKRSLNAAHSDDDKHKALFTYYRKFYTMTLTKNCQAVGMNKSPARDMILDYPWKELNLDRIFCLKVWEKINH
jgi:hypothetical protein